MYKSFFGLRENPFNINPDPRFLHRTPRIQEALDQLTFGVQQRKGLLLLTGEVGTGKTTLINHLLDWLRQRQTPTAFIFNSHLKVNHLFDFILNDFGISTDFHLVSNMLLELNQWLITRFREGSNPVLIVDEAQGLSFELLEEIRLLLNLETSSEKLLQIVLVGQPELEEKLKHPEMRQLRQRIALRCYTSPLTLDEARGYISDRLRIAGATCGPVFDSAAVEALHYYSRGIPRVMNLLCEHALINSYVEGLNPIPPSMVEEAARDFLMEEFRPLPASHGSSPHWDTRLNAIHAEPMRDFAHSFHEETRSSLEPSGREMPAALAELSQAERESGTSECLVATAVEEDCAASADGLGASLSVLDLVPPSPEFSSPQFINSLASTPSAIQSDCAAELVATMGRLLSAASSVPGPQRESSIATTENSLPVAFSPQVARLGPAVSRAMCAGVSQRVVRTTRAAIAAASPMLRQWRFGFRRDWNAMVKAIASPQWKTSLTQWMLQPFSSKPMTSSKNQTV
jgi:type II secretory pathway predicted ATPase ExeA